MMSSGGGHTEKTMAAGAFKGYAALEVKDLRVKYGGIEALRGISASVTEKRIVSLLGANGAGKTTLVRAVSGQLPVAAGSIVFRGKDITGMPVHLIQGMGLVQVPEGRKVFANLSVRENLFMGAYNNRDKQEVDRGIERIFATFPVLDRRSNQLGGTLSGGEQQMLAIGRAMMSRPKLLMMDEPSLGLAPLVVAEVFRIIEEIRSEGVTVFLIEQNAMAALQIADYAYLLETGRLALEGPASEVLSNPQVKQAYLGESSGVSISEDLA